MTRKTRLHRLPTLGALLLSALALLVLAGPAAAHHSSGDFADDPAGTIASFDPDSGQLVIDLADGGSISGLVTRFTWIDAGDDSCDRDRSSHQRRQPHDWCRRQLHHFGPGGHDWPHGPSGDSDDLVAGAEVDDALLVLKDGRAFFAKVELAD